VLDEDPAQPLSFRVRADDAHDVDGSSELPEEILDHFEGWRGSRPVARRSAPRHRDRRGVMAFTVPPTAKVRTSMTGTDESCPGPGTGSAPPRMLLRLRNEVPVICTATPSGTIS